MFVLIYVFSYCLIYISTEVLAFERKLGIEEFNCTNSAGTHLNELTIIEAKGEKDILFYFWDFGSKPTFLIVQVPLETKVKLNCDGFLQYDSGSIGFTSKPSFMFGVMLNKLYEFNDANDTAYLDPDDITVQTYNGEDFRWNVSFSQNTKPIPFDAFTAVSRYMNSSDNGFLNMAAGAYTGDGSSVDPPHILHTANGSQIDVILDNFQTVFNTSRFAVQLIILSSIKDMNYTSTVQKTVDDENTPAVFSLDRLTFSNVENSGNNNRGYLLWRPVVYTSKHKVVTNITGTNKYNMTDVGDKRGLFNFTLVKAIYGDSVINLFAKAQNVSFGSKMDKFYQKTRYSSWSLVFGTGDAPNPEGNSRFILILFFIFFILSIFTMLIIIQCIKLPCLKMRSQENLVSHQES